MSDVEWPYRQRPLRDGGGEQHVHRFADAFERDVLADHQIHRDRFHPRPPTHRRRSFRRERGGRHGAAPATALLGDMISGDQPGLRNIENLTALLTNRRRVGQVRSTGPATSGLVADLTVSGTALQRRTRCPGLFARWACHPTRFDAGLFAGLTFSRTSFPPVTSVARWWQRRVPRILRFEPGFQLDDPGPQCLDRRHQLGVRRGQLGVQRLQHDDPGLQHTPNTTTPPRTYPDTSAHRANTPTT